MSNPNERSFVLNLLEEGKIGPDDANLLLHALAGDGSPAVEDTVVFEIAADEDNLRHVVEKLNLAICCQ